MDLSQDRELMMMMMIMGPISHHFGAKGIRMRLLWIEYEKTCKYQHFNGETFLRYIIIFFEQNHKHL